MSGQLVDFVRLNSFERSSLPEGLCGAVLHKDWKRSSTMEQKRVSRLA